LHDNASWWKENRSAEQASEWLIGLQASLDSLADLPYRCPIAREDVAFAFEVRHLLYGVGSRLTHRAVFTIDEDASIVLVHAIRHVAQSTLGPEDL